MPEQIEMNGYKTRHFDMCPSAQALYKKILSGEMGEKNKELVELSLRMQDGLFGLEKMAIKEKRASEKDLTKAIQFAVRIMEVAENLDLKEEHGYIKMHVETIRDLVKKPPAEADTPDLMLKTGTQYVLKQDVEEYDRGLLVKVNEDNSYNIAYWYDKLEPYPIEVIIDGKSVAKDAKEIKLNFHPEIDKTEALQYGKPKKNDPRKTPAKPSERKKGSKRNKPKSASKPNKSIKFSKKTEDRLRELITKHNKKGKGPNATLGMLKAVYRRGAGAFSTSHAPKMSRDGWAMARVRAFLYLLRNGRPSNPNYKQDNDLLPRSHKRSSK